MPEEFEKLSSKAKTILYVYGCIHELLDRGMITGPCKLTPEGLVAYERLKASGWRPLRSDVTGALRVISPPGADVKELDSVVWHYCILGVRGSG